MDANKPGRPRCPAGLIVGVLIGAQVVCTRAHGDDGPPSPVIAVVTTPVGKGMAAEIAASLIPGDLPAAFDLKPARALAGLNRSVEQSEVAERAEEITRQAKEASLAFDLVRAAQLRRQAADMLVASEISALEPSLVAAYLLEAGAASVEAEEQDVALLYFRRALAVDGDIDPGPLISPEAQKVFESARALGPSYLTNPNDRTLRRLCSALGAEGVLWVSVAMDDEGWIVSEKLLVLKEASSRLDTRRHAATRSLEMDRWIDGERRRLAALVSVDVAHEADDRATEPDEPWYKKWWVYAVAGSVIAAGAAGVAIAVALQPDEVDVVVHH